MAVLSQAVQDSLAAAMYNYVITRQQPCVVQPFQGLQARHQMLCVVEK
jgi:hypothetical protein